MGWKKKGLIFCPDNSKFWSKSHASVPTVDYIFEENILRIYYSTRDANGLSCISFIEVDADNPSLVKYVHVEPVLIKGGLGTFDDCGVMPTWILNRGNEKYLYYIGWNVRNTVPYSNALGLAVSIDGGITFKKLFPGSILDRSREEPFFTASACLLEYDKKYFTYYLSCTEFRTIANKIEPRYNIKYAKSDNGIDFIRNGIVAIDYLSDDEAGISRPSVLKDSIFRMWYSYRKFLNYRTDQEASYKIGYAESKDGIEWERKDGLINLVSVKNEWDSEMQCYPHVLSIKGKLIMFYNGNGFGKTGIGYAEYVI